MSLSDENFTEEIMFYEVFNHIRLTFVNILRLVICTAIINRFSKLRKVKQPLFSILCGESHTYLFL